MGICSVTLYCQKRIECSDFPPIFWITKADIFCLNAVTIVVCLNALASIYIFSSVSLSLCLSRWFHPVTVSHLFRVPHMWLYHRGLLRYRDTTLLLWQIHSLGLNTWQTTFIKNHIITFNIWIKNYMFFACLFVLTHPFFLILMAYSSACHVFYRVWFFKFSCDMFFIVYICVLWCVLLSFIHPWFNGCTCVSSCVTSPRLPV